MESNLDLKSKLLLKLALMVHYLDHYKSSLYIVFDGWNDIFDPLMYAKAWLIRGGPIGFNNTFFKMESKIVKAYKIEKYFLTAASENLPPPGGVNERIRIPASNPANLLGQYQ